ncbi:AMP-binding protein [Alicyclobacillus sp. ALC3]|uniref:AMP-binding protein n=1 Tax=Alicyclobacillus sp. ALC3 TaxID=2796143 RepID=UPI0023788823|nr:AMP-binding protein [Alicyclobacillus sp. ALC3]WDL98588.1 AMP-binding protein [Alicyclobacillus sp. ALC3]
MNLVGLLEGSVRQYGDKAAMQYKYGGEWQSLTYQQLWRQISEFAAGLAAQGVKPGDKVAILSENCPEWVITDFAILGLGAVTVPVYPTVPADQVGFILRNADVTIAIVENAEQLQKIEQVWPEQLLRAIVIDGRVSAVDRTVLSFADVLQNGRALSTPGKPSALSNFRNIPDDSLATIVHTSGTSGLPKGVMLSHRNIVTNVKAALQVLPVEATDLTLSYLPLSHIFERTVEEFALLSTGATVCYSEGIDKIQENLAEICPTILISVPRLLEKVYSKVQAQIEDAPKAIKGILNKGIQGERNSGMAYRLVDRLVFKKLRVGLGGRVRAVVSGGAGLSGDIARFYTKAGIPVYEGYGMTETAPVIAANPFGQSRPGTVGRAVPGVEVRTAEDGELLVRGPNVMMGYYKQADETKKTVSEDGWLHTGDIAEIEPDGYIRIVDRKKNILVLATGKNVAPFPIENAISLSPYISEAILVGDGLKYVSALIVPDFEALQPMATSLGLSENTATWITQPEIGTLMQREVAKAVGKFAPFEQPKRMALLPHALTVEGGDITPSLKVKMKVIRQKYGHVIEAMYTGQDFIPVELTGANEEGASEMPSALVAATSAESGLVNRSIPDGAITPSQFRAQMYGKENTAPSDLNGKRRGPHRGQRNLAKAKNAPAPGTAVPTAEASSLASPKPRRSGFKLIIALVIAAIVGSGAALLHGKLKIPASANLNGEIASINTKNDSISKVNQQIVNTMQKVNQTAGLTGQIGSNLKNLQGGISNQGNLLSGLDQLSSEQVQLSRQLNGLSQTLVASLSAVDQSAVSEHRSVASMAQTANQLSNTAAQMLTSNQQSAVKLAQARAEADQVAREMP